MKYRITAVPDLLLALKELEPYIRNARQLRVGRDIRNMDMRPREVLGNWLLAVVLCHATGRRWTFSGDPTGADGAMLDRAYGTGFLTEHVFIPPPTLNSTGSVEEKIAEAVAAKAQKGRAYAHGKTLVVFSEAIGRWNPNRASKAIAGRHHFEAVWAFGLEDVFEGEYTYWVTHLDTTHIQAWRVRLSKTFDAWTVGAMN